MSKPQVLRYAKFKEEVIFGTPGDQDYIYVDVASSSLDAGSDNDIVYEGGFTLDRISRSSGFYSCDGNLVYATDVGTLPFFLKMALAGYVFHAGTPNKHEFYGNNDMHLPSFTLGLGKDRFEHRFTGCVVNGLEIDIDGDHATVTLDIVARKDQKEDLDSLTIVYDNLPAEYLIPFHKVTMKVGSDTNFFQKVKNFNLSISNNVSVEDGSIIGSRFSSRVNRGARVVEFSGTLHYDSLSELERLWGGSTGPAVNGAVEYPVEVTMESPQGDVIINLPRCVYTEVSQPTSGKDTIEQGISGMALAGIFTGESAQDYFTSIHATVENSRDEIQPGDVADVSAALSDVERLSDSVVVEGTDNVEVKLTLRDSNGSLLSGTFAVDINTAAWHDANVLFSAGVATILLSIETPGEYWEVPVTVDAINIGTFDVKVEASGI